MASNIFIESRDPFEFRTVFCTDLARLADAGNHVTIFLVQTGVLAARAGDSVQGAPILESDRWLRARQAAR